MSEPTEPQHPIAKAAKWIALQVLGNVLWNGLTHITDGQDVHLIKEALRWWLRIHS